MIRKNKTKIVILTAFILTTVLVGCACEAAILEPGTADNFTVSTNNQAPKSFTSYANDVMKFAIVLGGILAVIMITVGGFEYITAGGSDSKTETAKNRMTQAVIGLLVILGAWLILYTINPDLINLDLGITQIDLKKTTAPTQPQTYQEVLKKAEETTKITETQKSPQTTTEQPSEPLTDFQKTLQEQEKAIENY